jgi:hypothetical protein
MMLVLALMPIARISHPSLGCDQRALLQSLEILVD